MIGTDIVNIKRIERILLKYEDRFLNKNFHPFEIEKFYSLSKAMRANFLAKRFAGKEAISKAIGSGIGKIAFKDIAILNKENGQPYVSSIMLKNYNISISLSDDYPFAIAVAMINSA